MIVTSLTTCYLCAALLANTADEEPASARRDPFEGATPVVRYSFEADEDLDFDRLPDDWTRRKGPGFPAYIEAVIDRESGSDGKQSLTFDSNGGKAIMYSPLTPIDALHSYMFQGAVRTQMLAHDAAVVSVSLLNHERKRVQRFLSRPVSGTHRDWVHVQIGPFSPQADVRFAVIGCHLVPTDDQIDIHGKIWFDDLQLRKLPQLSLESNFAAHFKQRHQPIEIANRVSGLDPGRRYRLRLVMQDLNNKIHNTKTIELKTDSPDVENAAPAPIDTLPPVVWSLPPQEYGFYRVSSTLERDGEEVLTKETTFAVMDLVSATNQGEFGWSVARGPSRSESVVELADVAAQAGINWLKYPLWDSLESDDPQLPMRISELFERLARRHITPIGLLSHPPQEVRQQFANNWRGLSEVFTMSPTFWAPSLEPVLARYSSNVRHWQIGSETDDSFIGVPRLENLATTIKREFDRINRDTQLLLHWDWDSPVPPAHQLPFTSLSINNPKILEHSDLTARLQSTRRSGVRRFVLLKPLAKSRHASEERGSNLVKRMIAAKIGGAEGIVAWDVFDQEYGLLNPNASPTLLFLPWRSTAIALQGAEYLGSLNLPNKSINHAFARNGQVTLVIWSDEPQAESIYLGEDVAIHDIWGRALPVVHEEGSTRQIIDVGPIPRFVYGCSEPVTRWRMATQFQRGKIRSETGDHEEFITGHNAFDQGVNGTMQLNVPPKWKVYPRSIPLRMGVAESFQAPVTIALPPNASLGDKELTIDVKISADRPYSFRIYRPFRVGYGDILMDVVDRKTEDGRLEIEQIITNNMTNGEILNFSCSLFIPGARLKKQYITKLGRGSAKKFFYLKDAEALKGETLRIRAEQIDGRRVLNYEWTIGEKWEEQELEKQRRKKTTPAQSTSADELPSDTPTTNGTQQPSRETQ